MTSSFSIAACLSRPLALLTVVAILLVAGAAEGRQFDDSGAADPVRLPSSTESIPIAFDHLTTADGLSEGTSLAIVQDEQGFLWFATQNGLNRYDGYQFTVYAHDPEDPTSISDNVIFALYLADDGTLWVGTRNGGLNRLDRSTDTFTSYRHSALDPSSLSHDTVHAIAADADGNVWVGTTEGLNRLDRVTGTFTRYLHDPEDPRSLAADRVNSLTADRDGRIWVGTVSGLCRFDASTDGFTCFQHNPEDRATLSGDFVTALFEDSRGVLWAGTTTGLNAFDTTTGAVVRYQAEQGNPHAISGDVIQSIFEDREGRLWVGTRHAGLNRLDRLTDTFTSYSNDPDVPISLSGNTVLSIYQDRSGILWLGTWGADVSFIAPARHQFPDVFPVEASGAILELDGTLWMGTLEDGLFAFDRISGAVVHYQYDPDDPTGLSGNEVMALQHGAQGQLWIGTAGGLDRLDLHSGENSKPYRVAGSAVGLDTARILSLLEDSAGRLWIGTRVGLYCLDVSTGRFDCYQRTAPHTGLTTASIIYTIVEDDSGILWLGTDSGLHQLDPETGLANPYAGENGQASGLSDAMVMTIHLDDDGSLWAGTWGRGLYHVLSGDDEPSHFSRKDGMSDDLILGIQEDRSGRLWLSTGSGGLMRFDPRDLTFRVYDQLDGLPASDFNQGAHHQGEDGELFFGASEHVVAFNPANVRENTTAPPVVLTGFQLFNRPVAVGGESPLQQPVNFATDIILNHDDSVFSFEFAALDFSAPSKNTYAYIMEGFDREWNYVAHRRLATYTNLDPGSYTFRVKAANNDGLWNDAGLAIQVIIRPPWWQTWWAYTIYALAAATLIGGYVRFRTRAQARELAIQRRELARERQLREAMQRADRIKEEDRTRIAREMHDGLAQTLAGLRFRLRTWPSLLANNTHALSNELIEVGQILDDTTEELRRVIFALRPIALDNIGLAESLSQLAARVSKQYDIRVHAEIASNGAVLPEALEHAAFRLVQEALNNALRHAHASNIWLTIRLGPESLELVVRDDGVGFDTAQIDKFASEGHFGLINLRERVNAFHGSAQIESVQGRGTTVRVTMPIDQETRTDNGR